MVLKVDDYSVQYQHLNLQKILIVMGIAFLDQVLSPFLPQAHSQPSLYNPHDLYVNLFLIADATTIILSHCHSPLLLFSSFCASSDLSLVSGGFTLGAEEVLPRG